VSGIDSALRVEGAVPSEAVEAFSRWIDRHPGASVRVFTLRGRWRAYFHAAGEDMVTRSSLAEAMAYAST